MSDIGTNKAYYYVGRFISDFASIEQRVNELFLAFVGDSGFVVGVLLTHSFDLRKKLEMTQIMLKRRGFDVSKLFKRLHELHDLRNVIAHWLFMQCGDGLECDYIGRYGSTIFPKKAAASEADRSITFAEFDLYHAAAMELIPKLDEMLNSEEIFPIEPSDFETWRKIQEAIGSSDNVVEFPEKPRIDDED